MVVRRSKQSPLVCYNSLLVMRGSIWGSSICFLSIKYSVLSHTNQEGCSCAMKALFCHRVVWALWERFPLDPAGWVAWSGHGGLSLGDHSPASHCPCLPEATPWARGNEAKEANDKTSLLMGSVTRREAGVPQSLLGKCYSYSPSDMIGAYKSQERLSQHVPLNSCKRRCSWILFLFQFYLKKENNLQYSGKAL